jgi:hypothetical protein
MIQKLDPCEAWPVYQRAQRVLRPDTKMAPLKITISLKNRPEVITVRGVGTGIVVTLHDPANPEENRIGKPGYAKLCPEFGAVMVWALDLNKALEGADSYGAFIKRLEA